METTFITIHDLSLDARIRYASDSIVDILGHTPDEVVNKSSWDFFHPQEIPLAKEVHNRGVKLDKAAVLAYCQLKNRYGQWVGCECCFTVVYDVIVCCTSIYHRGITSQKRAVEAPIVRRLFASSPSDPRYHMLSHLSSKFNLGPKEQTHEPRAAMFLNRFTRTLTIMYATSGIQQILGISGEEVKGKSFYSCIQENCLGDAVRCLETAKGNDSIAYLRFWFRDPRQDNIPPSQGNTDEENETETDTDASMTDATTSEDEEGGVRLGDFEEGRPTVAAQEQTTESSRTNPAADPDIPSNSRTTSGDSTAPQNTHAAVFGEQPSAQSSNSSVPNSPDSDDLSRGPIELEAVVSCTSDGLVVCLRRARPIVPVSVQQGQSEPHYTNGLFAAPWGPQPMFMPPRPQPQPAFGAQFGAPVGALGIAGAMQPLAPSREDFMNSIRDVAVFAWALTGINGSLTEYSRGVPAGESQPPGGFPVWAPNQRDDSTYNSAGETGSNSGYHNGNST
ncbi:hypothetical protein K402DRAFT_49494 [Aulographum hederae CBS 113979]|uniref:PAS domain-containing protein n=1 Tax=Aulographum hederae CBS 113979 TaxID=1176131 RepID=A0A6G1H3B9_9PEZI|nr:hypothetical protein K402DRAFT_49494 [Aulographum hederae CBS 113979]